MRGFSFIYSGNFLVETELSEMGRLRCNIGIHPMGLQWNLVPGQCFNTPEVVLTRSSEGLGGMSRAIHRLFLDRLLPRNWSDAEPPVLLNSWEAKYFHVNHGNIVDMAVQVSVVFPSHMRIEDQNQVDLYRMFGAQILMPLYIGVQGGHQSNRVG